ncbi:Ig-like domain repeat protein [Cellulomonas sp. DKR-3]|uniref:Ig-like domain repeat protein n=1 Tax=Cellulomonas fulva TaxID=2835530 RepID=A0ABS5TYF2_9CELL|nr:immunoglobulin-like domain-containing protein [Cellulomonas fulva]MBT0994178.1 Ig-like domain repeat protein [Cellulomonas fulva]
MTLPRAATAALTTLAVTAGTLVGLVPAASAAAPTDELIAHYELDETTGSTVADSSGHGHDATVVGAPTWTAGGLRLSGAASNANYVRLPDGLLAGKASATVSMQVRADDLAGTTDNFLWNFGGYSSASGTGTGSWFVAPRNALRTVVTPSHWSGEQSATWTGNKLTAGKWQNVTATIEPNSSGTASTMTLYVDGALVATNTNVTTTPATLTDHTRNRLGGSAYDGDRGFPGTIGETRVYGAALSAQQVADLVADDAADTAGDVLDALDLGDTTAVTGDLALPTSNVTWTTSDAAVVTSTGVVTRPAAGQSDATATLTATATVAGQTATRDFVLTVKALAAGEDPMPATADLKSYFPLNSSYPGTPAVGTTTFTGATNAPVWTATHLDVTGGGYVANNGATGLSLTGSSTLSIDALIPSGATVNANSTLLTIGSTATTTNLSLHPAYADGKAAAVIRLGGAVVATAQLDHTLPRDVWLNLTVVLDDAADTLTVFQDGAQVAQATGVTTTASAIGTSVLRLNREGWGFTNLASKFRDLRVYSSAVSAANATALARQNAQFAFDQLVAGVDLPESVTDDVTLPGSGAVTWTSSDPAVVSDTGEVTPPAPGADDATVTLTVSSTRGGLTLSHDFEVTVPAELSAAAKVAADAAALRVDGADDLRSIVTLTDEGAQFGSPITWTTSDEAALALVEEDGTVYAEPQRPAYGHDALTATLTATVGEGEAAQEVAFEVTVPALPREVDDEGYAFAYFTANTVAGENIYLAASDGNNALAWNELNDGDVVLTSELGEKGLRDPFVIRSHEGDKFFLIATDLSIGRNGDWGRAQQWGSQYIEVWESTDLVHWSEQRHVKVSPDTAGMTWAPEAYWDDELGEYVVFWASRLFTDGTHSTCITTDSGTGCYARMMYATTKDFMTFSAPTIWQDTGAARIDTTVLKDGDHFYRFTKDEGGQTGCTDIIAERSTSLTTVTTKASAEANTGWQNVASCIARNSGFNGAVEGPTIFRANPGDTSPYDYYLYLDNYGGSGYFPLGTNDLSTGDWSIASGQLPASRHGTVMPVTLDQWQTLTGATVEKTASTTELALDDGRVATATVTALDGYQVGGRVTFTAGDWAATEYLSATGTATAEVPAGVVGTLTAAYAGTAEIATSTGTATLPKAASSVTLTRSAATVAHGSPITFKARVTGATTGTVAFWGAGRRLGTAAVVDGVATKVLRLTGVGTTSVTAVYSGTATVASSTSAPVQVRVRKAKPTSIAVTSSTFASGTRPTIVVKVGRLENGSSPVGRVVVRYDGWVRTVSLPASAKGVVKVTLGKTRTTALKVKATFQPTDTANVAPRSTSWMTMTPR